jgi:hypothetical protein
MTTYEQAIKIVITPELYDRANKMERVFYDLKGKDMGITESHEYFVGVLGELVLRSYLEFNNIPHLFDDVIQSDFGDKFDVKIKNTLFDVKTQKINRTFNVKDKWDTLSFRLYPAQVEKLRRKNIDYAYKAMIAIDYSAAWLIGYAKVKDIDRYKEQHETIGEVYDIPFTSLFPPWKLLDGFYSTLFK